MATHALPVTSDSDQSGRQSRDRDRRFFFIMACFMAFVLVSGFSTSIALRRSTFASPILFHLHAVTFFGWVVLYLLQTGLAATGSMTLHKRLGWLALGWVPAMVVLGTALTAFTVRTSGAPFFFDKNEFLIGNAVAILTFAGIVGWAIALRRRTDWHQRLMLCAMAGITGPGWGRLLPMPLLMPLLMPWAYWIASFVFPAILISVGMIADRRRLGRVHPAYRWGVAILFGALLLTDAIAYSPVGYAITDAVVSGAPGAARPMRASFPSFSVPKPA